MALKVPTASARRILDLLTASWGATLIIRLFTNNITPGNGDVVGDYTEAAWSGYAAVTMTGWTAAATVSGRATTQADLATFLNTSGSAQNTYGYFVTDAGGNLMWAERDGNAPVSIPATTGSYTVLPRFTETSEF